MFRWPCCFSLLLLLAPPNTPAQINPQRAVSFFPLQVGNKWQYEVTYLPNLMREKEYRITTVAGDTVMPNRKKYQIVRQENQLVDGLHYSTEYFRFDTTALVVYRYFAEASKAPTCADSEQVHFDLKLAAGVQYRSCSGYKMQVDTGFAQIGLLPDSAGFRAYSGTDDMVFIRDKLFEGIGIAASHLSGERSGSDMRLIAALINGKQYGDFVLTVQDESPVPLRMELRQNYPNPLPAMTLSRATSITFQLPSSGHIELKIFNILGAEIKTLIKGFYPAGPNMIVWDGAGELGRPVAAGVYFYRLQAGAFAETKKLLVVR